MCLVPTESKALLKYPVRSFINWVLLTEMKIRFSDVKLCIKMDITRVKSFFHHVRIPTSALMTFQLIENHVCLKESGCPLTVDGCFLYFTAHLVMFEGLWLLLNHSCFTGILTVGRIVLLWQIRAVLPVCLLGSPLPEVVPELGKSM